MQLVLAAHAAFNFHFLSPYVIKGEGQAGERKFYLFWCSPSSASAHGHIGSASHNWMGIWGLEVYQLAIAAEYFLNLVV